jgi:hypothetical protein
MAEELSGLALIQADATLSEEVKLLATTAVELDTPEIHAELQDKDGIITFASLITRMKEANPNATDADVEAATIAVWVF